jgi:hypothetical protein
MLLIQLPKQQSAIIDNQEDGTFIHPGRGKDKARGQ